MGWARYLPCKLVLKRVGHVDCDLGSFPDVCGGRLTVGAIFKDIGLEVGKCRARGRKTFKSGAMVV